MDVENTNLISGCHIFLFQKCQKKMLTFFREDLGSLRVGIDSHGDVEGSHRGHQLHHDGAVEQRRHSNSHSHHGEGGGGWVRGGGGEQLEGQCGQQDQRGGQLEQPGNRGQLEQRPIIVGEIGTAGTSVEVGGARRKVPQQVKVNHNIAFDRS